jgi:hypothetical protein
MLPPPKTQHHIIKHCKDIVSFYLQSQQYLGLQSNALFLDEKGIIIHVAKLHDEKSLLIKKYHLKQDSQYHLLRERRRVDGVVYKKEQRK